MELQKLVQDILNHLNTVLQKPETGLDRRLLEQIDSQASGMRASLNALDEQAANMFPEALKTSQRHDILILLAQLIPSIQQDPTPATDLIERVIRPSSFIFDHVLNILPSAQLQLGLESEQPSVNNVTLLLLAKAQHRLSDINWVATQRDIVHALITLWLATPDTGVAQRAEDTIVSYLSVDVKDSRSDVDVTSSNNSMYRRIFRDKDIYGAIYSTCSLQEKSDDISRNQKTIAQGRLLSFLLRVRTSPTRTTQLAEFENKYLKRSETEVRGLLAFAVEHMVDYEDDVLVYVTYIEFCEQFIRDVPRDLPGSLSRELQYLIVCGTHDLCLKPYLAAASSADTSVLATFASSASAAYIRQYFRSYKEHARGNFELVSKLRRSIRDDLERARGAQVDARTTSDIAILAELPHDLYLRTEGLDALVTLISPSANVTSSTFQALGIIFSGQGFEEKGQAAARALYYIYLHRHPTLWSNVIQTAESINDLDTSIAAINLIGTVITAFWYPLPSSSSSSDPNPTSTTASSSLPSESWLQTLISNPLSVPLPKTGIEALLSAPTYEIILPFLMKPNPSKDLPGDELKYSWRVAQAKFDVLRTLHARLKSMDGLDGLGGDGGEGGEGREGMRMIVQTIGGRIAQGPVGRGAERAPGVGWVEG